MFAVLPLLGVWLLAVVTPGPDFLVTVQHTTTRSRRHGVLVGLGVSSGVLIWATASMLGMSILFARLSWLYDLVRYAGAAYLLYLGVRALWTSRRRRHTGSTPERELTPGTQPKRTRRPEPTGPPRLARAWRVGFLTNIGNPKAAAFFGSLFGALLPANVSPMLRVAVIATIVGITAGWYTLVSFLFGLPRVARYYARARRWIDRVTAAVIIALGGRLALDR